MTIEESYKEYIIKIVNDSMPKIKSKMSEKTLNKFVKALCSERSPKGLYQFTKFLLNRADSTTKLIKYDDFIQTERNKRLKAIGL